MEDNRFTKDEDFILEFRISLAFLQGKNYQHCTSAVASSIIGGGGAIIHIFVFTDHKNNQFQKKLITQNTNI